MKPLTEADKYWADKPFKKWVVYVSKTKGAGGKVIKSDKLFVRARSYRNACVTGRYYSSLTGSTTVTARLAGPEDLGCVPYKR